MKGLAYQGVSQQAGASMLRETLAGIGQKGLASLKHPRIWVTSLVLLIKPAETDCGDVINVNITTLE